MWSLETSNDSASGIPSASKVALTLDRYLWGLEVQARGIGRCSWCLGKPKVVGKEPWALGGRLSCYKLGQAPSKVALVMGFGPLGRWAIG